MQEIDIQRHKTAISRTRLSTPIQALLRYGYLDGQFSLFDYGCGRGDDFRELQARGVQIAAWDPVHFKQGEKKVAQIVNLGFVINVIENPNERSQVLLDAFRHSEKLLVVSVMLQEKAQESTRWTSFSDGIVTQRQTFQKYYSQPELKEYVEHVLESEAIPVAPGIVFIFKDKEEEQEFLSERFFRRSERIYGSLSTRPTVLRALPRSKLLQQNISLFEEYWHDCLAFGRAPLEDEATSAAKAIELAGSAKRAFDFCLSQWGDEALEASRSARRNDLLVYLALNLFKHRKVTKNLPQRLQRDLKVFFDNGRDAQEEAKLSLFSIGKPTEIEKACMADQARLGFGLIEKGHSLTIHASYLPLLSPILRIYVGAAANLYGDVSTADLLKIHMQSGKLTLLFYEDFSEKCLPELRQRIKINMREQDFDVFTYNNERYESQPLYLKSQYVGTDFERYNDQVCFDKELQETLSLDFSGFGPQKSDLAEHLHVLNMKIGDFRLERRAK